jgi:glycosyltransferase involved in cell wall biosynthesis
LRLALDATYSLGEDLTGVGVYSREIMWGIAESEPQSAIDFLYRPHRFRESLSDTLPRNARRGLLLDLAWRRDRLFHGLNQRLPAKRFRRQVATFHDLFVMTADYSTPQFRERFTAQARHAAESADAIIAVSAFTAQQVTTLLAVPDSRIHVVHHGVRPLQRPSPQNLETAREKVVLHVGAIQKRKNLVRLVNAFESLPEDWRLVLAGGPGYGAAAVTEAIRQSPAGQRIQITGYLSNRELASWYWKASIFVFPSLDEGFGMPVLEAMACGVPVIASNGSALPEVCGEAAILVNPLDQDEITKKLKDLAGNSEQKRELIRRGFARASQFRWGEAVNRTRAVYRSLDSSPGG